MTCRKLLPWRILETFSRHDKGGVSDLWAQILQAGIARDGFANVKHGADHVVDTSSSSAGEYPDLKTDYIAHLFQVTAVLFMISKDSLPSQAMKFIEKKTCDSWWGGGGIWLLSMVVFKFLFEEWELPNNSQVCYQFLVLEQRSSITRSRKQKYVAVCFPKILNQLR